MTTEEHDHSTMLGKAVLRGVIVGVPVAYALLVLGLWLIFDRDFTRALETSALPGLLLGAFFGGFAGISAFEMARTRDERAARSASRER